MRTRTASLWILSMCASGCMAAGATLGDGEDIGSSEASDYELVLGASFARNDVVSDAFFQETELVDAADVQAFLERSPYGRCFLADESVGGRPFSELLVDASRAQGVNPLMLLARMQVEKSLISASSVPSSRSSVDFAFGCGCPDGRACSEAYRGLDRQVACAAQTHARRFADSADGSGGWRRGRARASLDGFTVTPANHATAALYAYTPHVGLSGGRITGGNALLYNVLQRFVRHLIAIGRITEADLPDGRTPWVGSSCTTDASCALGRTDAFCEASGGFCTIPCEGYCPDRAGHAGTFCVALVGGEGACVSKAGPLNGDCSALPGTMAEERPRHVGSSGAPSASAIVCVPIGIPSEAPSDPAPEPAPEPAPSGTCDDTCAWANDGVCDDGGAGSDYDVCAYGSDCGDCGPR